MLSHFKKITFAFSLLTVPFAALAQKMDKPVIDKFTNDTTLVTAKESIVKKDVGAYYEQLTAYFSKSHGNIYMHLVVDLPQADFYRFRVGAGSTVILKMADHTTISLPCLVEVRSATGTEHGGFLNQGIATWTADVTLYLSNDQVNKLSHAGVNAIRIPSDRSNMDFDVKFQQAGVFQRMLLLITGTK
jgi:hypothetical protein